jgi:plasmid replication initiation protein
MAAKKTELVVKSNRLVEASYRLNLIEQQVVLFAICRAREEEKGLFADLPVTIRAADFAAKFGTGTGTVYEQLKAAMDTLFNRHVVIHDTDPETGKPRVTKTRWISQASYVDGAGHIQFIFAPAVIPFITRLEKTEFTQYRLEKIGKMSSVYAVRMYETLVQYLTAGKRSLEVAWLRETLCLTGEYSVLADLKKRVIDVAVSQINEHSDIEVSYAQRKTSRVVSHLDFKIKLKDSEKPKPKKKPLTQAEVDKKARPGESNDAAWRRLLEENGQQRIPA